MDAHVVHSRPEGEVEDHHEKKSVMKKVKAKAKKLKDTFAGYGHQGHEQEGQGTPDDHDLDEEDDEEVDSPEVRGAPKYDSGPRRTDAPGQGGINSGEARHEYDPVVLRETKLAGPATGPLHKHEEPKELGGGTCTPLNTPVSSLPHGNDNSATMDVDSGSRQGGHLSESRLGKTDVLGGETPLPQSSPVSSLAHGTHKDNMEVDPKQTFVSGQGGHHSDQSRVNLDRPRGLEEDSQAPKSNPQADTPSNYETKVTDPTKSGGEETGVTPVLQSFDKMNLHGDDRQYLNNGADQDTGSHDQFSPDKPSNQGSGYITSATSAIANTAMSAKNVVASKLGYGGTESAKHDDNPGAGKSGSSPRQHQNQVLDPATDQFRPAETPQIRGTIQPDHNTASDVKQSNQSGGTYTEKISSATSVIADKAISAKNVVASKLGYGSSDQVHDNRDVTPTNVQPGSTQADQQGKKPITSAVAEKLSPVYGKVAGAGTAVMSKFQGGKTTSTEAVSEAGQGKGVSVKDYFVEKLRPGEEDKALSEVISEKLQINKAGVKEQGGDSASAKPVGKVTESEEVRQRLGSTEGNDNYVVNKIEDSVGSMLGGTNKNGDEHQSAATGEHRRLQEAGN